MHPVLSKSNSILKASRALFYVLRNSRSNSTSSKRKHTPWKLSGYIHSPELHIHGYNLHSTHTPLLYGAQEVVEVHEGAVQPPNAKPDHIGHVFRFTGASCTGVYDTGFGKSVLKLQYGLSGFCRLTSPSD